MDFQTFHNYNRLVDRGVAKPLTCPHDGSRYVTRLGKDDEPMLECFECNAKVKPGLKSYEQIKATVDWYTT
jgi:hypothetical protein